MTNYEMAHSYLSTAEYSLQQARAAHADGVWHLAVRRCQEGVELALKASLRLVGLEVPKVHDVSFFLRENSESFPEWFRLDLDRLAHISRSLRKDREISLYGDEALSLPPERVFTQVDANEALEETEFVFELTRRLFEEYPQP
jgi:HEPN domain-containing protein